MTGLLRCAAVAALAIAVVAGGADARADDRAGDAPAMDNATAASYFGRRADIEDISLSPDGDRIVIVSGGVRTETRAQWAPLDGSSAMQQVTASDGKANILRWCEFVSEDRLICHVDFAQENLGDLIGFWRLLALDLDGGKSRVLGQSRSLYDAGLRQSGGAIVNWLPEKDGKILYAQEYVPEVGKLGTRMVRDADGLGVVELDTRTNKSRPVERPDPNAVYYLAEGDEVRVKVVRTGTSQTGQLSGEYATFYRQRDSGEWLRIGRIADGASGKLDNFRPTAIDGATNRAFGFKSKDGRDAIYALTLDGSETLELVYAHPSVDVGDVVRFGAGGRVVGVRYTTDRTNVVYFDPYLEELGGKLRKALPNLPVIEFVDASVDENVLLIFAASDSDPGRYYAFRKDQDSLQEIALARPVLEKVPLSSVLPVSYPAADGTQMPG